MSPEGILNIDKPQGITSHDVVKQVRRLSGIKRVGHAGTLDPLATGVILVCIGRATRLVEYLVGQPKRYVATVRLGQVTDSYDAEGEVIDEMPVNTSQNEIEQTLPLFRGHIKQRAPAYSAIKLDGQPLYKLARQGKVVKPPVREIDIYDLQLLAWDEPFLQLELACSSGTYVRSLAHDLGQALGCGGHITALRRVSIGDFSLDSAAALNDLRKEEWLSHLLPTDTAVQHLPRMALSAEDVQRVQFGQQLARGDDQPDAPLVRIYEPGGQFMGLVKMREDGWQPHKVFLLEP